MSERPGPTPEELEAEGVLNRHLRENLQMIKEGISELEPIEALSLVLEEALGVEGLSELELEEYDYDEALGLAFTALIENGIEDPEAFLIEKNILQASAGQ